MAAIDHGVRSGADHSCHDTQVRYVERKRMSKQTDPNPPPYSEPDAEPLSISQFVSVVM